MSEVEQLRRAGLSVETVGELLGDGDYAPPPATPSHVTIHRGILQGSPEWIELRRGVLTASEMHLIMTPRFAVANNDKARAHVFKLLSERITGWTEPNFESMDTLRGHEDEIEMVRLYQKHCVIVDQVAFITNDKWGFTIGYSPDGLVGSDGLIEGKSRRPKYQIETAVKYTACDTIPPEFMLQCQTGLLVSERSWLDFMTYAAGLPMFITRVYPDPTIHNAIVEAAGQFEAQIADARAVYDHLCQSGVRRIETQRHTVDEIFG